MKKKHLIIGTTMIGLVAGGYFLTRYIKKKRLEKRMNQANAAKNLRVQTASHAIPKIATTPITSRPTFPLLSHQSGQAPNDKVRTLQQSLLKLPLVEKLIKDSGGADGILGQQTAKAIQTLGYSLPLSESDYKSILTKSKQAKAVATVLTARGRRKIAPFLSSL